MNYDQDYIAKHSFQNLSRNMSPSCSRGPYSTARNNLQASLRSYLSALSGWTIRNTFVTYVQHQRLNKKTFSERSWVKSKFNPWFHPLNILINKEFTVETWKKWFKNSPVKFLKTLLLFSYSFPAFFPVALLYPVPPLPQSIMGKAGERAVKEHEERTPGHGGVGSGLTVRF